MGKKTSSTKPTAPLKRAAKTQPPAEKTAPPAPRAAKAAPVKKKPAPPAVNATAKRAKKPTYSQDDVALRAYFIAERRHAEGIPGDAHQDWVEAERQLAAEAKSATRPKSKKA